MINKVFTTSTNRLSDYTVEEINTYLSNRNEVFDSVYSKLSMHSTDEGEIWIAVPEEKDVDANTDEDLIELFDEARQNGCCWLCISDTD